MPKSDRSVHMPVLHTENNDAYNSRHDAEPSSPVLSAAAAAAALVSSAPFIVPNVYDPSFHTAPDSNSVLVHSIASSSVDPGLQVILSFHPRPDMPAHLGLPPLPSYEERAFLQVAPENHSFVLQTQAARSNAMQITVTEYLILLQFVNNEWPRLQSKLESQLVTMREKTDPVFMTGHLVFYSHGSSQFKVSLSSRLVFKACIQSRDPDKTIKAWLERNTSSTQSNCDAPIGSAIQELVLPMNSVLILAQDYIGVKTLIELMGVYKSKSRKRQKPVVS